MCVLHDGYGCPLCYSSSNFLAMTVKVEIFLVGLFPFFIPINYGKVFNFYSYVYLP